MIRDIRNRLAREDGTMTTWLMGLVVILIMLVGAGVELGGYATAEQQLRASTDQAARAAGNQIDKAAATRGDGAVVDQGPAVAAAQNSLSSSGVTGQVTVTSTNTVRVDTSGSYQPKLLAMFGVGGLPIHASAEADSTRTVDGQPR